MVEKNSISYVFLHLTKILLFICCFDKNKTEVFEVPVWNDAINDKLLNKEVYINEPAIKKIEQKLKKIKPKDIKLYKEECNILKSFIDIVYQIKYRKPDFYFENLKDPTDNKLDKMLKNLKGEFKSIVEDEEKFMDLTEEVMGKLVKKAMMSHVKKLLKFRTIKSFIIEKTKKQKLADLYKKVLNKTITDGLIIQAPSTKKSGEVDVDLPISLEKDKLENIINIIINYKI